MMSLTLFLPRMETLNGLKLNTPKKLSNWLNNLYQDNIIEIISYKNLSHLKKGSRILADDFDTLKERHSGIANFKEKLSLEGWVKDSIYVNLTDWIKKFHLLQGRMINKDFELGISEKTAINFVKSTRK